MCVCVCMHACIVHSYLCTCVLVHSYIHMYTLVAHCLADCIYTWRIIRGAYTHMGDLLHAYIRMHHEEKLQVTVRERESGGAGRSAVFLPDPTLEVKIPKEAR